MQRSIGDSTLTAIFVLALAVSASHADLVVDGLNNYSAANTYSTSTAGYTGYAAMGPTSLNFGISGNDVQSGGSSHWFVAYIGAAGTGTTNGVNFNTQQPTLSFQATHFFQWRPSDQFATLLQYNGANWVAGGTNWSTARSGQFNEIGINLSDLGAPTTVKIATYFIYEGNGFESSYASTPSNAFAGGSYDPNIANSLTLSAVPETSSFFAAGIAASAVALARGLSRKLGKS
jgi:hypothetical protein